MMEARAMGTAAATTASITAAERKLRRVRSDNIGTSSGSDRKLVPKMLHQNAYAPGSCWPFCANFNRADRRRGIRISPLAEGAWCWCGESRRLQRSTTLAVSLLANLV